MNKLILEAEAFDSQIIERIKNGHIPDLRYSKVCEYFYNNSWRDPEYVKLDFGDIFELISKTISENFRSMRPRILEIGCGPGYMTLEFARNGYNTVGLDLSTECITIANYFASRDPHIDERADLSYVAGDLFKFDVDFHGKFDVVVFIGALHHFPDQDFVMRKVKELLTSEGIIIVHEPTRDRVTRGNAAFVSLLKTLLSAGRGYYEEYIIPENRDAIMVEIELLFKKLKYEDDHGEKLQSINDNEAGYKEMYHGLKSYFNQVDYQERYSFFHEIIGGLRFENDINIKVAKYLRECDKILCELGVLQPTEFYFVGK